MALTNRLSSTTNDKLMPKLVDTVLGSNVFCTRALSKAKKWAGANMKFPIKYQDGTDGSSFSGFDTFSTSASQRRINLSFEPKFYYKNVVLPLTEVDINKTEQAVINLAATEVALAAQEMADELGTIFYSDGTGNSSKDFLGLQAIVDDSTNASTYGGQARATYSTLNATYTDCSSTLTLAKMSTLYHNVTSGSHKPTLGLTTETVFALYERLLQPMERINQSVKPTKGQGLVGEAGFTALLFKGVPIIADEKCTSGVLYFVNENYLDWYALPSAMNKAIEYDASQIDGNDYGSNVKGLGFSWTGWIRPTNGYSVIGHIILGGELISADPGKHGQLHTISTV